MSQYKIDPQITGKKRANISRHLRAKLVREKYKSIEAQTLNNTVKQSQPPNVCPEDTTNTWTPNLPLIPQDSWSQPQGNWPQPQGPWSQPEGTWSQPQGPWSQPEGTWPQPQGPWSQPEGPWSQPEGTWSQPQGPWSQPEGTWSQPQGPWSQPEGTWSQPQGPWSQPEGTWPQPQANAPNNIFNFGPTNIAGNFLPQNHIEQPLPNQNQNTFPNQSNQPKKSKKKMKVQQQPKKKLKVLTPEEQRKREAELRMIEQKYRQVVMIHRTVSASRPKTPPVTKKPKAKVTPKQQAVGKAVAPEKKAPVAPNKPQATVTPLKQQAPVGAAVPPQIKAPAVLNKSTSQVTPSKRQGPVEIVAPPQIKIIGNTKVTPIPPGQSSQPPATSLFATKPSKRQRSKKNKKWSQDSVYSAQVQVNLGAPSQYQAPHQDEPEDLTDDLAPNMAGGQQQPGTQQAVTVEKKLNFKFQRSLPKNPDWSEYQSKFRRIGGGSPEPAQPPGAQAKLEPAQAINTDSKPPIQSQSGTGTMTGAQQNTGSTNAGQTPPATPTPQKPPATPKVELVQKPANPNQQQINRKLMEIKNEQTNQQKRKTNIPNSLYYPFDNYPKGIPKSFLQQTPQAPQQNVAGTVNQSDFSVTCTTLTDKEYGSQAPQPQVQLQNPAGIPKSFLQQTPQAPQPNPEAHYLARDDQPSPHIDLPSWILASQAQAEPQPADPSANAPMFPTMFAQHEPTDRPYSPTDIYSELPREEEPHEGSESPDALQSNQKRLSAFKRLGPLAQPKKPKLTINLTLNKEQAVREVVDETDESSRFIPVHLRKSILESEDETVKKYLPFWPWRKNIQIRKAVSARRSKSVMILEQEQMETGYEKNSLFIQVSVKGYPKTWNKEDVLDAILDCVKGKHFIPCFIEFTPQECKFLVIRCKDALVAIHKVGFCVRAADAELIVSIALTDTGLNQIDLIPRLVLRKRLMTVYDGENTLNLTEFFAERDVSHFVYFPLNRHTNQLELIQLQSAVAWEYLTELNLSHNRLTSLSGFDLCKTTPRLKRLDLSHNRLDHLPALLPLRDLPLRALRLEGNPLCHDYVDARHYVKVVRMMFSGVMELDGVRITLKGDLPAMKRNYCPEAAVPVVEKFLETFFPLLEAYDDRAAIEDMYDKDAVLTITFRYKIRYGTAYRYFRNLFMRSRSLEEGELESIEGSGAITALLLKWPAIQHDRYSMTVDVLHHDDFTTVLRIGGILKLTAESLAEDEHLLTFARTVVLHTRTGAEYKIHNEMLSWDVPREEVVRDAFNVTTVRPKQLSLKLESPPDEDLKSKLVDIFVKLADIDKKRGARCLELKNWDLRSALEYYISLLKLDDLSPLSKESTPAPQAS